MNDPVPTAAAAEREVFAAAAALAPEERATFLEEACAGRSELRVQVEQWLRTHESSGFMEAAGEHARPLAEAAGERIGRYELIERIGEGGFGVVWMAEQREPVRRRVALKIIKLGMDTREVVARFEQERQALALMDHPHIAKVFDAGATPAGRPFFVMELVRGVKISDYCDEARLTTEERLGLFIAVCQAVQHAHQKGIIHRDLKPSNILVAVQDGVPVPKVIDFGVAKAIEGRLTDLTLFTQREQLIGTPIYMSPEQAESGGVDIDTRSDIYSLGVMLYELLTGRTPVDRETLARAGLDEVRRIIREQEPPRPSLAARPAHPIATDLDWIAMKALEKDRTRRYDSAAALAEDVRRHLHDEPVSAGRPGVLYRGRKWVRRHKVPAAIAGILILTALAVLTLSIRHAAQMKEQRDYAQSQERRAESVLQREQLLRAEDFLHRHDVSAGLAYLAHVLRREPGDVVTASRLLSAIVDRSHFLPLFAPIPHESAITQVEFTPDGRRIFSADQRQAWMWDAESGRRLLGPVRYAGDSPIIRASLSPDGRRFVLTGIDSQVFDSETGTPVTSLLAHPGRPRGSLWAMTGQFSPDGSALATISTHLKVCLWNVATSQLLCPPLDQGDWPSSIAFSPDGKRLAVGTLLRDRVLLWEVATGEKLADWPAPGSDVSTLIFTRDGQRLFAATQYGGGAWFDIGTHKQLWPTLQLEGEVNVEADSADEKVNVAALSADEKTVITCSHDGAIRHWDAASGQAIGGAQEHGKWAWMRLSRDGEKIASVTDEPQLWLWNRTSSVPLIAPRRLSAKITAVNFSPDAQRLVVGTADGMVTVLQAALIGARPLVFPASVKGWCKPAMNPEGTLVVTGDGDVITRWDAQTARPLLPTLEHSRDLQRLAFSPDGSRFVSGTLHGPPSARVWEARTAKPVTDQLPASGYAVSVFLSDDNKLLGVIGQDQTADVWNVETGQRVAKGLGKNTQQGAFGGHGRWLLVMMDTTAAVWDLAHGAKQIGAATGKSDFVNVSASPAGDCFATASQDGVARVWSFDPVRPLSPPLVHRGPVVHVSFSSDGKLLATASADGTARLWDWAAGRMLTEPLPHREAVSVAIFSPDGRRVATAAGDQAVRIWDVATGRPLTEALFTPGKTRVSTGRPFGLQWSADGRRLLAKCYGGAHPLWQLLEVTAPAPPWLADWAEALGGQRLDESGRLLDVGFAEYQRFRERAASLAGSDVYGESLRWFFAPGPARPIAPGSRVTAQDQPAQPQ